MEVKKSPKLECAGRTLKHIQSDSTDTDTSETSSGHLCRCDEQIKVLKVHTRKSQSTSSWSRTRAVLLAVSIILGIIFFPWSHAPPFRFHRLLSCGFSGLLSCVYTTTNGTALSVSNASGFSSNGRTNQVQWDKYTLALRGQRVLL